MKTIKYTYKSVVLCNAEFKQPGESYTHVFLEEGKLLLVPAPPGQRGPRATS